MTALLESVLKPRRQVTLADKINSAYYPAYYSQNRFLLLYGGAGSGKSVFAAQKILLRTMANARENFVVVRKIANTLRVSVWAELLKQIDAWGLRQYFLVREVDKFLQFAPNGSIIQCLGLDDPEKIKSIAGVTGAWLEEPTELDPGDLTQINLRIRGETPTYKQIILTFNPISRTHWLKPRFFDNPDTTRERIIKTTYLDNRFIDEDYKHELESMRDRDFYNYSVYCLGEWGVLRGLIYDPWPVVPLPENPDETIYGLDFGFNNPTALVRIDVKDAVPYVREEVYESGLITRDLIGRFEDLKIDRNKLIYADAAEPDRIAELQNAGYNVWSADKGQGSVRAGIDKVKSMTPRLAPGSQNILNELNSYKWAEKRDEKLTEEPAKFNDHALDAIRYALFTHFSGTFGRIEIR